MIAGAVVLLLPPAGPAVAAADTGLVLGTPPESKLSAFGGASCSVFKTP